MRLNRGRHRKPTTAGRTVAKVAVTGAVLGAAGVAFAAPASAASDSDWDQLAQCEAGGNWAINTGNGFQGGLQFSPSTWTSHGGGQYAASANQASREQQIVVAEKVLASQGWGAWPSCSSNLGLSSGPSQRSAPAAPAAPEWTAPETWTAPEWTAPAPDVDGQTVADAVDTVIATVEAQGIQIDPALIAFIQSNKGALGL